MAPVRHHSFLEIDHEIFSTSFFSLLLIKEGQLSVTGGRMGTKYWLTVLAGGADSDLLSLLLL